MRIVPFNSSSSKTHSDFKIRCAALARLHTSGAPDDVCSQMGETFLGELVYPALAASEAAIVLTLLDGGEPAGFVAAASNIKKCITRVVFTKPVQSVQLGFLHFLHKPKASLHLLSAIVLKNPEVHVPSVEIFMISVSRPYRRRGFGKALISALHEELVKQSIGTCLARVREANSGAISMYRERGYHEIGTVLFTGVPWVWLAKDLCVR